MDTQDIGEFVERFQQLDIASQAQRLLTISVEYAIKRGDNYNLTDYTDYIVYSDSPFKDSIKSCLTEMHTLTDDQVNQYLQCLKENAEKAKELNEVQSNFDLSYTPDQKKMYALAYQIVFMLYRELSSLSIKIEKKSHTDKPMTARRMKERMAQYDTENLKNYILYPLRYANAIRVTDNTIKDFEKNSGEGYRITPYNREILKNKGIADNMKVTYLMHERVQAMSVTQQKIIQKANNSNYFTRSLFKKLVSHEPWLDAATKNLSAVPVVLNNDILNDSLQKALLPVNTIEKHIKNCVDELIEYSMQQLSEMNEKKSLAGNFFQLTESSDPKKISNTINNDQNEQTQNRLRSP